MPQDEEMTLFLLKDALSDLRLHLIAEVRLVVVPVLQSLAAVLVLPSPVANSVVLVLQSLDANSVVLALQSLVVLGVPLPHTREGDLLHPDANKDLLHRTLDVRLEDHRHQEEGTKIAALHPAKLPRHLQRQQRRLLLNSQQPYQQPHGRL